MKLLPLIAIFFTSVCYGQKSIWPKPIKDSVWYETQCDTTYGKITFIDGAATITGKGVLVNCTNIEFHKNIYSKRGQEIIDSIQKSERSFILSGTYGSGRSYKLAYIIFNGKWKSVYSKYTFVVE